MESSDELVAAAGMYLLAAGNAWLHLQKCSTMKKKRQQRRWWMTSIHRNRTRESMELQLVELTKEPSGEFHNFLRMSITDFESLIHQISPAVARSDTYFRDAIPVKVRLALTLRYLATGDSYRSLHYLFKISSQLISRIIPEVCLALIECLKDSVKLPSSSAEWIRISEGFPFPHCVGAVDGKHIRILRPSKSASEYYNYKGGFSIVLLALVDSYYCFLFANIGAQGRISDGGVFRQCQLWEKINDGSINLPQPCTLPGTDFQFPFVFLGDGAFALHPNLMKPYSGNNLLGSPQRVFNQKLSSSRVVVENAFGIMASVFRVFSKPIALDVKKASIVTLTCVLLHNMLRESKTSREIYTPNNCMDTYENDVLIRPGAWRHEAQIEDSFLPIQVTPRRPSSNAIEVRCKFTNYIYLNMN